MIFTLESYIPWTAAAVFFGRDGYPIWGDPYSAEDVNNVCTCGDGLREFATREPRVTWCCRALVAQKGPPARNLSELVMH
jgi:hypothetical protein